MLIDRLLENLDIDSRPFATCEVASGSRLEIGNLGWVNLHFVLTGTGTITVGHSRSLSVQPYSLVIVRREHSMRCLAPTPDTFEKVALEVDGMDRLVGEPEGDPDFVFACGELQATYSGSIDVFEHMPDPLVLDFADSTDMIRIFDSILAESRSAAPGSRGMIGALMHQALVLIFRRLSEQPDTGLPWLEALQDERLARVVDYVLERPDSPHSVESLAYRAGMSRSAFAERFRQVFAEPPMTFVRHTRLRAGAAILSTTDLSVGDIARRVGFSSRSHFSHAFHEFFGQTPGEFRTAQAA